MSLSVILSFIVWVLLGGITAYFAGQRGRDPRIWFGIGIFFGLLGLLVLFLLPSITKDIQGEPSSPALLLPEEASDASQIKGESPLYLAADWFCIDKSLHQRGPLSYEILKTIWHEGKIDGQSFVWCEGMAEWKRVAELSELYLDLEKGQG